MEKRILGLCVRVWTGSRDDIALIYADPILADLQQMITEQNLYQIISDLLWPISKSLEEKEVLKNGIDLHENRTNKNGIDELQIELKTEKKKGMKNENVKCDEEDEIEKNLVEDYDENDNEELNDLNDNDDDLDELEDIDDLLDASVKMEEDIEVQADDNKFEKTAESTYCQVHDKSIHCDLCGKPFKRKSTLKAHLKTCKALENNTFSCEHCELVLDSKPDLKMHMKTEHPSVDLQCRFCDYVAHTLEYRNMHEKRIHLNLKCVTCRKIFGSEEEKTEHKCVKPDRFQCDRCEKSYLVKTELKKHINIAHEGQKFPCELCSDVLSSSQALKRHTRNVHEIKVKNFKCQFCGKSFKDKQTLQKHEKIHDEIKSDPCPECGKILSSNDVLRIHIRRVHERNFKHTCEDCGKSYPYLHALQIHAEMAHLKGAMLMCTVCGKEFIGKHRLRNHMIQKHPKGQEFTNCEHCGKEVPVTQLRSHVVEAHKMQGYKFQCTFCPKRFDTKAHIREHIRKHTGARPFLCRGCGKYFFCRETAKKHVRLFHGEDLSLVHYDVMRDVGNPFVS